MSLLERYKASRAAGNLVNAELEREREKARLERSDKRWPVVRDVIDAQFQTFFEKLESGTILTNHFTVGFGDDGLLESDKQFAEKILTYATERGVTAQFRNEPSVFDHHTGEGHDARCWFDFSFPA